MAGTNRNQKLRLEEAWKHYWSVLFPSCVDWRADLEAEIRLRLYYPGEVAGFPGCKEFDLQPPSWASNLELGFGDNLVAIKYCNTDFGKFSLFRNQLVACLSNWATKNPLEDVSNPQALTDRDRARCGDFFIAVIHNCGNRIRNKLLRILKETKHPMFEIYCRPSGDIFAAQQKLPVSGLSEVAGIDITNNALTGRLGTPICSHVEIKRTRPSNSRAGPRGSFREQDAPLIEEMKKFLDQGEVRSVREAAYKVLRRASRRKSASDDSVVRRLQDRFSTTHPNYSTRLGKKGEPSRE